ncbi:MAG: hypothetical protein EA344_12645 [Alkalicoccus sp.]|nr:MAG: hypothetical protein EA344_12645 [Alkalicoccus sp.]
MNPLCQTGRKAYSLSLRKNSEHSKKENLLEKTQRERKTLLLVSGEVFFRKGSVDTLKTGTRVFPMTFGSMRFPGLSS